ncbi:BnaAnng10940D [Brassica napus]|uniref:BnaAnng10940D protein n=1 Tax=Brassica napus TaxID=3708 RepID=A0A078IQI3_BRANA|nr:BnaAnng10940D [Brassica napus]
MDSSVDGAAGDSSKSSGMSVEEKIHLVYELSAQPHLATEVLQAWSRKDILQILCAEMGKERKYTGLTKVKLIETLLKTISKKNSGDHDGNKRGSSDSLPLHRNSKRPRKVDNPTRYVVPTISNASVSCNNLACRAVMGQGDSFCRRCSCCICLKYDDNKDPSLWLTCSSDPPFEGDSCGFSCHLECAFKSEKSGLARDKEGEEECCFYCVSCGKPNSLLECWKKQLTIAKETRRVDVLSYRLLLVQKLIKGSTKFSNVCEVVDEAVKSLEADVGPLSGLPMKMGRGIVNRLGSGPDVQKLCSSALESLQPLETKPSYDTAPTKIRFEDVNATSLTVILASNDLTSPANIVHYSIWHRKVTEKEYQEKSTCTLFTPNARFVVSGLAPASEYCFKVVSFSGTREVGVDEINVLTRSSPEEVVERSESPLTNCSTLSSNPSSVEADGFKHCVSVIRQLESLGHIEKEFRQKFLTWYGLRATPQEIRIVKIFIDTFADDPVDLAEQLVHTFNDRVLAKRCSAVGDGASAVVKSGFCMKLWH